MSEASLDQRRRRGLTFRQKEEITGWLLVAPWVIGFILFIAGPMLATFFLAFTEWDILTPLEWVGVDNFVRMATKDDAVPIALRVTTVYAFVSVPLQVAFGLIVAMLLNQNIKLQSVFRTVFYLPSVVSGVAVALLWRWIFSPDFGLLNAFLSVFGINGPAWLADTRFALPALIVMSLWGVGGSMVIYLAGLQGIPTALYEAAELDGASPWSKFWRITIPQISPVLLFQTIMGIIGALQVFTQSYVMTDGGPQNATLFMMLLIYRNGFQYLKMGYASSLALVLFVYIMVLTLLIIRSSTSWVYYEGLNR